MSVLQTTILKSATHTPTQIEEGVWLRDDFLDHELALRLYQEAKDIDSSWVEYRHFMERKSAFQDFELLSTDWQSFYQGTNSTEFVNFLKSFSGIEQLSHDEHRIGAGIQKMGRGDFLSLHRDFSHHPVKPWRRRLNCILFLSPEWKEDWGGELVFQNDPKAPPALSISPIFNRVVFFTDDAFEYHGVPQKLSCPAEYQRVTYSSFYFIPDFSSNKQSTYYPPEQFADFKSYFLAKIDNQLIHWYVKISRNKRPLADKQIGRILNYFYK